MMIWTSPRSNSRVKWLITCLLYILSLTNLPHLHMVQSCLHPHFLRSYFYHLSWDQSWTLDYRNHHCNHLGKVNIKGNNEHILKLEKGYENRPKTRVSTLLAMTAKLGGFRAEEDLWYSVTEEKSCIV